MMKYFAEIPFISQEEMIEVDRKMIEEYQIELIQMMENAGRNLAVLAREKFLKNNPIAKIVVVLCGKGNNAGGCLVAARHLSNWGANTLIVLSDDSSKLKKIPKHQLDILAKMNSTILNWNDFNRLENTNLILDGIFGYNLSGNPAGVYSEMINWANDNGTEILSLDIPSGVKATTGEVFSPSINADATLTLALPKIGMLNKEAKGKIGELYLADISVPPLLYKSLSINLKKEFIFSQNEIIKVW